MAATNRQLEIMKAFQTLLKAVTATPPPDPGDPVSPDAWPLTFDGVHLGPLKMRDARKTAIVGIVAGPERKKDIFPWVECFFTVFIEFRGMVMASDLDTDGNGSMELANRIMTTIQRVIYANKRLTVAGNPTVIDTKEVANEYDLETYGDKTVVGLVAFEVQYRHDHQDTR